MHHHPPHPPANPAPANPHNNQQIKPQHPPTQQQLPQPLPSSTSIPIVPTATAKLPPQPRTQIPQSRRAPVRFYTTTAAADVLPRSCGPAAGGTRQVELFNVFLGFVEEGVEDVGGGDVAGRGGGGEEGGERFGEFCGAGGKGVSSVALGREGGGGGYRWRRRRASGLVVMPPPWNAGARGSCLSVGGGEASCWWTTMAMNVPVVGVGCDGVLQTETMECVKEG